MRIARLRGSSLMAGLSAIGVGALGVWEASHYSFGSWRQLGPAVFPTGLSALLALAGVAILIEDMTAAKGGPAPPPAARPIVLVSILGSLIAFALLVERFGLAPAVMAAVIIASLAERRLSPLAVILLGAALAAACTVVFYWLLNLPLRPFIW